MANVQLDNLLIDMKNEKDNNNKIKVLIICMVGLWILFWFVPFCVSFSGKEAAFNVSFAAATALFTGVAFVVAYSSLYKQQETIDKQQQTLIKQINLSVFSDSMKLVMDSDKYNLCREYIYSNNFKNDIEEIRKILDLESANSVSFDDFRLANQSLSRTARDNNDDEKTKKRLSDSYEKIKFFCMRMEFLGVVVSRENAAETLIIDYYGYTITDTYERLKSLIETTRKNKDSANLYRYYSDLYEKVISKRKVD